MPTVEPSPDSRFARVADPDFEPLFFDAAHVSAVVGVGDGCFELCLIGGQRIRLPPPIASGVLKQLGLSMPRAKPKPKRAGDRAPAVKHSGRPSPSKSAMAAASAMVAGLFSWQ